MWRGQSDHRPAKRPITPSTPPPAPWSIEAVAAADAAALGRKLPPMMAFSLRRIESGGLRGIFDLYVPHWHLTLRSCRWFANKCSEWIGLPSRQWTDKHGRTHYDDNVVIDDVHAQRFQDSALEALHRLLARAAQVDTTSAADDEEQSAVVTPLSLVRNDADATPAMTYRFERAPGLSGRSQGPDR